MLANISASPLIMPPFRRRFRCRGHKIKNKIWVRRPRESGRKRSGQMCAIIIILSSSFSKQLWWHSLANFRPHFLCPPPPGEKVSSRKEHIWTTKSNYASILNVLLHFKKLFMFVRTKKRAKISLKILTPLTICDLKKNLKLKKKLGKNVRFGAA